MIEKINKGFTYIELITVIAIVGALSATLMVTVPSGMSAARDTRRKSDLNQYRTALERYANKNDGFYPQRFAKVRVDTTLCVSDLGYSSGDCPPDPYDSRNDCNNSMLCRYMYQTNDCGSAGDPCATDYILWTGLEKPESQTTDYYVVCSNGTSGEVVADSDPDVFPYSDTSTNAGDCPL